MLLVRCYIDRSIIHGLGLFAVEPIPANTAVWRFTPGFDLDLDLEVLEQQPPDFRERLLHYGYIDARLSRYILCCDDARFINHSDEPNLKSDMNVDRYGVDIATRDIQAGEELTIDYNTLEGARPL